MYFQDKVFFAGDVQITKNLKSWKSLITLTLFKAQSGGMCAVSVPFPQGCGL